ncbi:hypothetical protein [Bacillus sp. 03113]|uniref:hypothetical protein n=1 Tax=Bacillus sp. 03113 TaxID=2578211 RepID=UPI00114398C6|nr:hypothetical protein [Bacillus sp. 03113]
MDNKELEVYFSYVTFTGDIPSNIESQVKNTFSRYEVEYLENKSVVIKVPKSEMETLEKFKERVRTLLLEIKKENSVLADKLAHRYGF